MNYFKSLAFACSIAFGSMATFAHAEPQTAEYRASLNPTADWEIPQAGPAAQADKSLMFIAASLRNSGILGVAEGVSEASEAIGWHIEIADARGSNDAIEAQLANALASPPDGLIIGGFDAAAHAEDLRALHDMGTSIVGWHAGPVPGAIADVPFVFNVTTDPLQVARVAAEHAIVQSSGQAGVVIFTDSRFEIALAKSGAMEEIIQACTTCRVLATVDVPLDETATQMPVVIDELLQQFGEDWTVSLGINDLYFDDAVVPFSLAGIAPSGRMINISAGDGSLTSYQRIRLGNFQDATVPEPLNFQGWQIVDELNRLMAGETTSGYVAPTKLVINLNVDEEGGERNIFDPANGYRSTYAGIWTGVN